MYNLDLVDRSDCTGVKDWLPALDPVDVRPTRLIGFNYARSARHPDAAGCHFFLDDYQFGRVWRFPSSS